MTDSAALLSRSGEPFATGASKYLDTHPEHPEDRPRIYVKFRSDGLDGWALALLDTGGHFCILNRSVAKQVEDRLTDQLGEVTLQTARGPVRGDLHLLNVTLVAEQGEDLEIDAVVFVAPEWEGPCFIGYSGMLDRLRWALDPDVNTYYFGRLA